MRTLLIALLVAPVFLGSQKEENIATVHNPGITAPVVIHEERPSYTADAIRRRVEGTVVLRAIVLKDGTVREDVKVVTSLDPDLDQQAIKAARLWTFKPAEKDGKPVNVVVSLQLSFKLKK